VCTSPDKAPRRDQPLTRNKGSGRPLIPPSKHPSSLHSQHFPLPPLFPMRPRRDARGSSSHQIITPSPIHQSDCGARMPPIVPIKSFVQSPSCTMLPATDLYLGKFRTLRQRAVKTRSGGRITEGTPHRDHGWPFPLPPTERPLMSRSSLASPGTNTILWYVPPILRYHPLRNHKRAA
jgi:hypothetical protein